MDSALISAVPLLLIFGSISAGRPHNHGEPEWRLVNTTQPVELPCPIPAPSKIEDLEWKFTSTTGSAEDLFESEDESKTSSWCDKISGGYTIPTCNTNWGNYSLLFTPTWERAGVYHCKWKTKGEEKEVSYRVGVLRVTASSPDPALEGSNVTLNCELCDSNTFRKIKREWALNNTAFNMNTTRRIFSENFQTLTMLNIKKSEQGRYWCRILKENVPQAGAYYTLNVIGSTHPTEGSVTPISMTETRPGSTPRPSERSVTPASTEGTHPGMLVLYILVPVALVLLALLVLWRWRCSAKGEDASPSAEPQRLQEDSDIAYVTLNLKDAPSGQREQPSTAQASEYAAIRV